MRERAEADTTILARTLIAQRNGRARDGETMHSNDHHEGAKAQDDLLQREVGQARTGWFAAAELKLRRDYFFKVIRWSASGSGGSSLSPGA